jgi:hypothetical protein
MDTNNIDIILSEIVSILPHTTLVSLFFVNKKLNKSVKEYLYQHLNFEFYRNDAQTNFTDFCNDFMKRIRYGEIYDKYNSRIRNLRYDYCDICSLFGLQYISSDMQKYCINNCIIKCCGIDNILSSDKRHKKKMSKCDCCITSHFIFLRDGKMLCNCGNIIVNKNIKCTKCNKIPLYFKGFYKGTLNQY